MHLTPLGLSLVVVMLFAAVHVLGRALLFLRSTPRSSWLSIAGGVSVAYVFVHLLPELASHQEAFAADNADGFERHVYVFALAGLVVFYALDRLVRTSGLAEQRAGREKRPSSATFRLHLASYALYNLLIGYLLLHREEADERGLIIYAVAMTLHFIVNDQGLREYHGQAYDTFGRWFLAGAPAAGWLIGFTTEVSRQAVAALFAFLAGGVVLNVLKEELPEERESRIWAFALGVTCYAALLLETR